MTRRFAATPWLLTLILSLMTVACLDKGSPTIVSDAGVDADVTGQDSQAEGTLTDLLPADVEANEGDDKTEARDSETSVPDGLEPQPEIGEIDVGPELPEHCAALYCGDGSCDEDCAETPTSCAEDCCSCGDGVCDHACGEDTDGPKLCLEDCCVHGDGICEWHAWCGETGDSSFADCCEPKDKVCGDGICDWSCGEDVYNTPTWCYNDCCVIGDSVCANGLNGAPQCGETGVTAFSDCCICGDGVCKGTSEGCDEWFSTEKDPVSGVVIQWTGSCPNDCESCGNGACVGNENYGTCAVDCCGGCGDGLCRGGECGETPETCVQDCESYACGNSTCDPGENPELCPTDCQQNACGNGVCEPGEDLGGDHPCTQDCAASCGDCTCEKGEDRYSCPIRPSSTGSRGTPPL